MYCPSAPNLSFLAYSVALELDPAPVEPQFSFAIRYALPRECSDGDCKGGAGSDSSFFQCAAFLMAASTSVDGEAHPTFIAQQYTYLLWQISSPPEQQAAFPCQRQASPGAFVTTMATAAPVLSQELHPQSPLITTEVPHGSVSATIAPQNSETQPHKGSASEYPDSFLVHTSLSICYLCTSWNSLFPF